jgi:predicted DNA-binding transcriptional regulator AlpA
MTTDDETSTKYRSELERLERLNIDQAAEYLGMRKGLLYSLRGAGTGPASYKLGNRVMYDRRDLDLYVARCKAATLVGS